MRPPMSVVVTRLRRPRLPDRDIDYNHEAGWTRVCPASLTLETGDRPVITRRVERFFEYARMRHLIYLDRKDGKPRPWTRDPVLSQYRITNVFRELDATTVALRKMTVEIGDHPNMIPFVTFMRWLNRQDTWQYLVTHTFEGVSDMIERIVDEEMMSLVERELRSWRPRGPWVTGAYIIKTPEGMDKLAGIVQIYKQFLREAPKFRGHSHNWFALEGLLSAHRGEVGLQEVWEWIRRHDHQGDFTAYEVVSDLRHTPLLDQAPDIMTWANAGPGAMRGLNRLSDRPLHFADRTHDWQGEMRELLRMSRDEQYWPQSACDGSQCVDCQDDPSCHGRMLPDWPRWEMRETEHWLCEFDKISRVLNGEGAPRGRYP